jgi:hypothetical protein
MKLKVGEVISIKGTKIILEMLEEYNKDTIFFEGKKYKGVSLKEHVSIQRGFRDIICIIEGEYLDERSVISNQGKTRYIRKVEVKPIGYFENGSFHDGIKYLPMIKDGAFLMHEHEVKAIYGRSNDPDFVIGKMLKEDIHLSLPWDKIFNSHIGIFGNTGSGKSNTLSKIYTTLFENKHIDAQTSRFVVIDFNGEYTGEQLVSSDKKKVHLLNTNKPNGENKVSLSREEFWDEEILSILFQATSNTQKPFLKRVINRRKKYSKQEGGNSLLKYTQYIFEKAFTSSGIKDGVLNLLRLTADILTEHTSSDGLSVFLEEIGYHTQSECFYINRNQYFNSEGERYKSSGLESIVQELAFKTEVKGFHELKLRIYLQLIEDSINQYAQFEHIQPLLKRMEAAISSMEKVAVLEDGKQEDKLVTVISLRNCNQDIKKVVPLLITKQYYQEHKKNVQTQSPPEKTLHIIIDEAHNILSQQSVTESENWKDYRLELFEEIIKEGRKFAAFLTLSSQRPADISPTIMSQVHNFFIHRLVNDRDLFLLDSTISSLDSMSKSLIPSLSKGCCIITGTSFDLPIILQIDILQEKGKQPDSGDVQLKNIWKSKQHKHIS